MNRRSFFSRMAAAAAGIVLASSVEVMGFKPLSLTAPETTLRTISMLVQTCYGPIIPKSKRDDASAFPEEPQPPEGFHIVDVQGSFGDNKAPKWIESPQHGEDMGYWAIMRNALPEGISAEAYTKAATAMGNCVWERSVGPRSLVSFLS